MPSKSKAQARFFAAAAHNPDFAKKAGMSTKTAKEWNKADKKAGTLKKGSKKPERVKEEVLDEEILDEASGVGQFPVPPSSLKLMQKYASSIVLTYAYKSFQQMQQNTDDEVDQIAAKKVLPFLKRFQQKYGAQVLNDSSMRKYVNQSINMPIDHAAIFRELPKSLQNDAVKSMIEKMRVFITFDAKYYDSRAGGHAKRINDNTSEIILALRPNYFTFTSTSGTDGLTATMERMDYFMGSLEHEMQHAFQEIVTSKISSRKDKNLDMKKDYGDMGDAYHASGVEFGPQTKDMINAGILWLDNQKDNGELSGNANRDIKAAIQHAFKRLEHGQGKVYQALKNYKEDANAKKHMTLIFKGLMKHYHEMENEVDSELDLEPKEVDGGESRLYHSTSNGPDDDFESDDPLVQIYRAMESKNGLKPYHVEEERQHGVARDDFANPYNHMSSMVYALRDGGSVRFMKYRDAIRVDAYRDGKSPSREEGDWFEEEITSEILPTALENMTSFRSFNTIAYFFEDLKHKAEQMNLEDMASAFPKWFEAAKEFSGVDDPNKKLSYEYDEGTLFFRFAGARGSWYIQDAHDGKCVLEDNETYERKGYIKYDEVEDVMTLLFAIYQMATDRQINRVMKNINELNITVDSLSNTWEYVQESSKAPVEESSMRSMMDLVQDAEIANGIDQAEKSTDISRKAQQRKNNHTNGLNQLGEEEQLDEMPMRFDSFQGQDPDEFVDKTAQMTGKANLVPFAEHDTFTVMRNKNYTGFIAFDKQGKQIAVVSGYLSQDAVLGVKNVFEVAATASKSTVKGVMYQIFMDMTNAGISVLSDKLHSDSAIKFWTRLIGSHEVYIVGGGEVLAKATPEKIHKYWSDDENSPSAELQLLLVG